MTTTPDTTDVRVAEPSDSGAIGRLLNDFHVEFDEPTPGSDVMAGRVRQLLAAGEITVLLGGGEPEHGLALLRFWPSLWSDSLDAYLEELYVVPTQRGQGRGRALMEAAIELARSRGAADMQLGTSDGDVAARGLYESLGFVNREGGPDGPITYFYVREL